MAVTKLSGSRRTTQVSAEVPSSETSQPPSRHVRVFEAIANLNRGFDQVLADVIALRELGFFRDEFAGRFAKTCRLTVQEMRAWAIFETTEALHERAEEDWARFGRMLLEYERKFRDPNDVLIEAERLKQKLQKEADQKTGKKRAGNKDARERAK
jgi:hypothetical protein